MEPNNYIIDGCENGSWIDEKTHTHRSTTAGMARRRGRTTTSSVARPARRSRRRTRRQKRQPRVRVIGWVVDHWVSRRIFASRGVWVRVSLTNGSMTTLSHRTPLRCGEGCAAALGPARAAERGGQGPQCADARHQGRAVRMACFGWVYVQVSVLTPACLLNATPPPPPNPYVGGTTCWLRPRSGR